MRGKWREGLYRGMDEEGRVGRSSEYNFPPVFSSPFPPKLGFWAAATPSSTTSSPFCGVIKGKGDDGRKI
jgi:hypothetical protein